MMMFKAIALMLAASLAAVQGEKDDTYYMAGSGNPNADLKMYWKDADNILTDINEFSSLYVRFHHCAWTQLKYPDSGNDVDESDLWYQGKTPPMAANVAFSLYGSLKGETFKGCNKNSFIKSFYTNRGYHKFAKSMYYAGVSGFSNYYQSDDDGSSATYTAKCNYGYGVGCTYSYGFTKLKYSGDYCNPENVTGVVDTMSSLNSALDNVQCQQIYDSKYYTGYVYGTPLEILAYSSACFVQNYWSPEGECPDPYGVLEYYQSNFNNGIKRQTAADPYVYQKKLSQGKNMAKMGLVMLGLAAVILLMDRMSAFDNFINGGKKCMSKNALSNVVSKATSRKGRTGSEDVDLVTMSRSMSDEATPQTDEKASGVMT